MSVLMANAGLMTEGDAAFLRVNNREPAHALAPGVVARAVNCRFDQGKPGPRYGIALDGWGEVHGDLVAGTYSLAGASLYTQWAYLQVTLTVGQSYFYVPGAETYLTTGVLITTTPGGDVYAPDLSKRVTARTFIAPSIGHPSASPVYLWTAVSNSGGQANARIAKAARTCAYARFSDPDTDTDNSILVTDEWRTSGDGGR